MRAIITSSDIEFSVREVDLGYCTTVESVRQTITMTNTSILAQLYGFCGVPEVSILFSTLCNVEHDDKFQYFSNVSIFSVIREDYVYLLFI